VPDAGTAGGDSQPRGSAACLAALHAAWQDAEAQGTSVLYGRLAALVVGASTSRAAQLLGRGGGAFGDVADAGAASSLLGGGAKQKVKEKGRGGDAAPDGALASAAGKQWRHPAESWGQLSDVDTAAPAGAAPASVLHFFDDYCLGGLPFVERAVAGAAGGREDDSAAGRAASDRVKTGGGLAAAPQGAGGARKPAGKAGAKAAGDAVVDAAASAAETAAATELVLLPTVVVGTTPALFAAVRAALSDGSADAFSSVLAEARLAASDAALSFSAGARRLSPPASAAGGAAGDGHETGGAAPAIHAVAVSAAQCAAFTAVLASCLSPILRVLSSAPDASEGKRSSGHTPWREGHRLVGAVSPPPPHPSSYSRAPVCIALTVASHAPSCRRAGVVAGLLSAAVHRSAPGLCHADRDGLTRGARCHVARRDGRCGLLDVTSDSPAGSDALPRQLRIYLRARLRAVGVCARARAGCIRR
jgi:hypothetical protein